MVSSAGCKLLLNAFNVFQVFFSRLKARMLHLKLKNKLLQIQALNIAKSK